MNNLGDVVSYFESIDSKHLYGYSACPIALVNEQIYPQGNYQRRRCEILRRVECATY
jgi:hypothetical protein